MQIAPGAKRNLEVCRLCQNNAVIITAYKGQGFEACQHEETLESVSLLSHTSWVSLLVINKDWKGFSTRNCCFGEISDISSITVRTELLLQAAEVK